MDKEALVRFLEQQFPQAIDQGYEIADLDEHRLILRLVIDERHLRPGGTVSGPTSMGMADAATYLLILAHLGPVALAVTTNLNIHFMRKPRCEVLLASTTLLKLGKSLAVGEVRLHPEGKTADEMLYAHATVTYALPPAG